MFRFRIVPLCTHGCHFNIIETVRIAVIAQWERNKSTRSFQFIYLVFCCCVYMKQYKVNDIICTWCITATQYVLYLFYSLLHYGRSIRAFYISFYIYEMKIAILMRVFICSLFISCYHFWFLYITVYLLYCYCYSCCYNFIVVAFVAFRLDVPVNDCPCISWAQKHLP